MVESFVTGIVDNWPEKLRKHRRYFTFGSVVLMLILSLPMVTEVDIRFLNYIFNF